MSLLVFVFVCADAGTAMENGKQEARGVQKPGKTCPTIACPAGLFAKASWSSPSTHHGLLTFTCLSSFISSIWSFTFIGCVYLFVCGMFGAF